MTHVGFQGLEAQSLGSGGTFELRVDAGWREQQTVSRNEGVREVGSTRASTFAICMHLSVPTSHGADYESVIPWLPKRWMPLLLPCRKA